MDSRYFAKTMTTLAFKALVYQKTPNESLARELRAASDEVNADERARGTKVEEKNEKGEMELKGYLPEEADYALVKKNLPTLLFSALEEALVGLPDQYLAILYDHLSLKLKEMSDAARLRFERAEMDEDDLEEKRYKAEREKLNHEMQSKSRTLWLVAYVNDVNTNVYAESEAEARLYAGLAAELIRQRAGWKAAPKIRAIGKSRTFVIAYDDGSHEAYEGLDEQSAENYARHMQPLKTVTDIFHESDFSVHGGEHHVQ